MKQSRTARLVTCSLELSVFVVAFGASLSSLVADVYRDIHWCEGSLLVVLRSAVLTHRNLRKLREEEDFSEKQRN